MKKALFLMAIITMLGCSKDEDNEEERQKNPPMSYEMFCYLYFDGYLVNDTTELTNLTDYTKPNQLLILLVEKIKNFGLVNLIQPTNKV